jgi:phosphoglycerate dehydrogenase-like enzyme
MIMEKGVIIVTLGPDHIPEGGLEKLKSAGGGREVRHTKNKVEVEELLEEVEIGIGDVPFSLIPRMPRLAWVQLWSAGADWLQKYPDVKSLPFQLTSASGMHGPQIAEHLFGMLFSWNRRLPEIFAAQKRHEWLRLGKGLSVLDGKTMLILGYGSVGKSIAKAAQGFGMKVIGIRRHESADNGAGARASDGGAEVAAVSQLFRYLPKADIVVNTLPFTQETKHSFGAEALAAMKKTALYCNMGRGRTTDETALIGALQNGDIGGALLDVTETEPLPEDSPLWDMDKVLLSAHNAGFHPDYDKLALDIALDNLGRYVRGETLKNVIDKNAGY